MTLRANIGDLTASGTAVIGHGEHVAAAHAAADSRIDAAAAGWQGSSAAALTAKAAAWTQTTATLLARLSDHAQGLHTCADTFHQTEQRNAEALLALGRR